MSATELPVRFRCECGADFEVTARWARVLRKRDDRPKCRRCEGASRRKPTEELTSAVLVRTRSPVTDRDRQFWLDRFSLDELCEIAYGIWPDEVPVDPGRVLVAI